MSKTLVAYLSLTGNTQKIAEAIFSSLDGAKTMKSVDDIQDQELAQFKLIFIGFPVHSHSVPFKTESLIKKIPEGKQIAFFSTHGSLTGSRLAHEALEYAGVLTKNTKVLGTFTCRGQVSLNVLESLSKSPEHTAWTEMAASARSHPDEGDLEDARSFARWMQSLSQQD